MKNVFTLWMVVLTAFQMNAQNEVSEIRSVVLPLKQLITHAADAYPAEDTQKLIVLIETGTNGITMDERFYLEQGLDLLRKRLNEDDQVAIFTYGAYNEMLLPFSSENLEEQFTSSIDKLNSRNEEIHPADGIDLAYEYAEISKEEGIVSKVLLLRNKKIASRAVATLSKKQEKKAKKNKTSEANHPKLGGAIALTALTVLPEILEVIKN